MIRRPLVKEAPPPQETDRNASQCNDGVLVQKRGACHRTIGFRYTRRSSFALNKCVSPLDYLPKSRDFYRQPFNRRFQRVSNPPNLARESRRIWDGPPQGTGWLAKYWDIGAHESQGRFG